jgi:hypothetical protein
MDRLVWFWIRLNWIRRYLCLILDLVALDCIQIQIRS